MINISKWLSSGFFLMLLCVSVSPYAQQNDANVEQLRSELSSLPENAASRLVIIAELVKACWRACPAEAKE